MENKVKIIKTLKENKEGLTITELVKESKLSRSIVRAALLRLEGEDKVYFRQASMAKIYSLKRKDD